MLDPRLHSSSVSSLIFHSSADGEVHGTDVVVAYEVSWRYLEYIPLASSLDSDLRVELRYHPSIIWRIQAEISDRFDTCTSPLPS